MILTNWKYVPAAICLATGLGIAVPAAGAEAQQEKTYFIQIPGHKPIRTHRPPRSPLAGGPVTEGRDFTALPASAQVSFSTAKRDVTEYHYDGLRTGWNSLETQLTPATVASNKFGLLKTITVDGTVHAQPLLVSNFIMKDGRTHDVLVVATGHNSVYAIDAKTYAVLWTVNIGTPQSSSDVGCSDVVPEYGISSTPVIIRSGSSATIYFVGATEPTPYTFLTQIFAYDLKTGKPRYAAKTIAPSGNLSDNSAVAYDPRNQWSRAGLAVANSSIYVSIGSHCDSNAGGISGWILRYSSSLALQASFHTIGDYSDYQLSSIWMSGFAPAIDESGNILAVTGNGSFDVNSGGKNYGESIIELANTLATVKDWFTPATYDSLNGGDTDFGSGGVMLLPKTSGTTPIAVAMGKESVLYVVNRSNLGHLTTNNVAAKQAISVPGYGLWGGPAYYKGPNGGKVFIQSGGDVLRSFSYQPSTANLTAAATGTSYSGDGGSFAVVSSSGSTATGVVWVALRSDPVQLEAYNAETLGDPIFVGNAGSWQAGRAFVTPMEANGRVYLGATNTVSVFGLTN